ncbi:aquaporin AQPAe.a-like [Clytia hemisphaerica]|uniref:Aquaporin n=1 Tax=Clytia hemisphaerica TaxID=252671 RepID=A0A7M5X8X3_9CNID|eukprot:TCONS_00022660-protein
MCNNRRVQLKFGADELSKWKLWRAVLAEFVGTMLFLLCVTTVALFNAGSGSSSVNVEVGIGIGLGIATLSFAFGHVSGGHLNPAVTFGMIIGGRISFLRGLFYTLAQVVGAIAGSAITYACTSTLEQGIGKTRLGQNFVKRGDEIEAIALEMLFTFILVFFVFSVTDPKKKVEPYAQSLGIGVCIWVCHVCLIPYTNCSINPARSTGPAIVISDWNGQDEFWIFWLAPMLGGALAAVLYTFVFYVDDSDEDKYEVRHSYAMETTTTTIRS